MNNKEKSYTALDRWVTIGNIVLIFLGIFLIYYSRSSSVDSGWREVILGIGLGLAPSGIVGFLADWLVFGRLIGALNISTERLDDRTTSLKSEINSLRISTDFLKQSSNLGLEMIYTDRGAALREFAKYMEIEAHQGDTEGKLIIVGSSIKGLLENVKDMPTIMKDAIKSNCNLQILVTHPKYSRYRENQEDRPTGAIEDEIFKGIRTLEECVESVYPDPPDLKLSPVVRFYKGTPTCFMIIAGDRMLINPYPYEEEAYKSFCIQVQQVEVKEHRSDTDRSIFAQYQRAHFDNPWKRNAVPYRHFWLEGPDPNEAWDRNSCYGDVFVVQDASHFYLSVNLNGQRKAAVRGMPTSIPYCRQNNETKYLEVPDKFSVRLYDGRTNLWVPVGCQETLALHPERRRGILSTEVTGNLLNDYRMLGLFDADEKIANPNIHPNYATDQLRGESLPLFYVWLDYSHTAMESKGKEVIAEPVP